MLNKLPLAITLAIAPALASAHINIVFDYTYDSNNFFGATQKSLLEAAAGVFESRITDNLGAIVSGGSNSYDLTFDNPGGAGNITLQDQTIAVNELRIYVGATSLGSNTLGMAGRADGALRVLQPSSIHSTVARPAWPMTPTLLPGVEP